MAEETAVSIRIDKQIDGDRIEFGVPVTFRPIADLSQNNIRRSDRSRKKVSVVAPVSASEHDTARLVLPWGDYEVEAVLPSGELLSRELTVGPNVDNDASDAIEVILRGERSPSEWRSWGNFSGAPLASVRHFSTRRRHPRVHVEPSLKVTIGDVVQSSDGDWFDASSWANWFEYLDARFNRGSKRISDIRLAGESDGLSMTIQESQDGSPLRIKFLQHGPWDYSYPTTAIGKHRIYVAITGQSGTRLFALPLPWGGESGGTQFEMLAFEDGRQLRCDPVLRDARWAGLVAYLNRGRVDLASEIFGSARTALLEKFENPLAAAIGGYVLLSSLQDPKDEDIWPGWLSNLAHRFPNLPDGPILRARWLLAQNDERFLDEAHVLLYDSVKRGVPFFTTGVVWLIEGLEQTSIECLECQEILRKVRGVARQMDLSQAFTSFFVATSQPIEETVSWPLVSPDDALGVLHGPELQEFPEQDLPQVPWPGEQEQTQS